MAEKVPIQGGPNTYNMNNLEGQPITPTHRGKAQEYREWALTFKEFGVPVKELITAFLYGNKQPNMPDSNNEIDGVSYAIPPGSPPVPVAAPTTPPQYKSEVHKRAIEEINKLEPEELLGMVQALGKAKASKKQ